MGMSTEIQRGILILGLLNLMGWNNANAATDGSVIALEDCTVSAMEWEQFIQSALDAYKNMETETFMKERTQLHTQLMCVQDVLPTQTIALFHQMEMLYAFGMKDKAAFGGHAQASILANAEDLFSTKGIVNDGHPILQWNAFAIEQAIGQKESIPSPLIGESIYIDGVPQNAVPSDMPYVFQRVKNGRVVQNAFVQLDDSIPLYPHMEVDSLQVRFEPVLFWSAVGLGGASVSMASLAQYSERRFWDPSTPQGDLVGLQHRTNVLSVAAILLGVAGVTTMGTSVYLGVNETEHQKSM